MKHLQCIDGPCRTARLSTFHLQLVLKGLFAWRSFDTSKVTNISYSGIQACTVEPLLWGHLFWKKNSCHTLQQHAQSQVRFPPMLVHTSASTLVLMTRLPCWLPRGQQVSHQMWIWGIDYTQAMKHASKGSIVALKPREDVTRSPKQG